MKLQMLVLLSSAILFSCASNQNKSSAPAPEQKPTATAQATPAKTEAKSEVNKLKEYTCKKDNDVRTLRIESVDPKGCKLWYRSEKSPVASSVNGVDHCLKVRERITGNLEKAKYSCSEN